MNTTTHYVKTFAAGAIFAVFALVLSVPVVQMATAQTNTAAVLAPTNATVAPAPTTPVTADTAVVVEDANKITIPVASWVDQIAVVVRDVGVAVLPMIIAFVLTMLPAPIRMIAGPFLQKYSDGILNRALEYGVNAVKGATKDGELTVDVGNKVLAHTAQYALDHGPTWWAKAMGGEDGIRQKIFARLNIPVEASIDDFDTQVQPAGAVVVKPAARKYHLPQGGK